MSVKRRWSMKGLLILLWCFAQVSANSDADDEEVEDEIEPSRAVLFPSFSLTIGVITFWLLSRYAKVLPYTAVMFLIGTLMGVGVVELEKDDQLNESIRLWVPINSQVLLLVFLPGLIFKDAFGQNVHLFLLALGQCIIFAFPMVLAGTTLTALIVHFVFPYDWSFNLAMVAGATLSATDPVAVAALLEAVGAPPRLKVHIAGEALLNDGAAIVFFDIFVERYLHELGMDHIGEDVGLKEGVAIFFQKALGAVAVGIFFGIGLLAVAYYLNRRFSREENVVEVTATIAIAYLGYYVAEIVWKTSGVLATVACGVVFRFLGRAMINDVKLLDDFWTLVEHLLNTVLFTLGGVVWGAVIAKGEEDDSFTGRDWGFLVFLYIMLSVIRIFLFCAAYPITSRIGLKTNWSETLFQVYGGLRGAVGIALALFLDNEVRHSGAGREFTDQTRKLFGFVGGIAFMTLCINGTTAGPLLKWMGLADSTETREKIVRAYHTRFVKHAIDEYVRLMTERRFRNVNFALVVHHVPYLADMTRAQLFEAVEAHKETTRPEDYKPPYLKRTLPYLKPSETAEQSSDAFGANVTASALKEDQMEDEFDPEAHARKVKRVLRTRTRRKRRAMSTMRVMMMGEDGDPMSLQELRGLFISILRAAYETQMRHGELQDQEFLAVALEASLDFAEDVVEKGEPLCDWGFVHLMDGRVRKLRENVKAKMRVIHCIESIFGKRSVVKAEDNFRRLRIERSLAFMAAHRFAQNFMQKEFENADCELSELGKQVLSESQDQYRKAEEVLSEYSEEEVETVVSHKFCLILLNSGIHYISKLEKYGLLKESEAEHQVCEIEEHIENVLSCNEKDHPGEVTADEEMVELQRQSVRFMRIEEDQK